MAAFAAPPRRLRALPRGRTRTPDRHGAGRAYCDARPPIGAAQMELDIMKTIISILAASLAMTGAAAAKDMTAADKEITAMEAAVS